MAKPAKVHTVASLKANTEQEGDCLLWKGSLGYHEVPQIYNKGEGVVPVRRLLSDLLGKERTGRYYGVSCENPRCIAPVHIEQRSQAEHSQAIARISNKGAAVMKRKASCTVRRRANPPKLDMERAAAIRVDTRPTGQVADEYGIDRSMVWKIRTGRAWLDTASPFAGLLMVAGQQALR
jgi:hypothetical protein